MNFQATVSRLTNRFDKPESWRGFAHQNEVISQFGRLAVQCTALVAEVLHFGLSDIASAIRQSAGVASPSPAAKKKTKQELLAEQVLENLRQTLAQTDGDGDEDDEEAA